MSSTYRVALYSNDGAYRYDIASYFSLSITKSENAPGVLMLSVPASYSFADFEKDGGIIIYRSVDGGPQAPLLNTMFLIREVSMKMDTKSAVITIKALDLLSLLSRRIVYAAAGSAGATKTGLTDTIVKQFVSENLRSLPITVQVRSPTTANNQTISKSAAQQDVLSTIQDCARMSAQLGTYYLFDVIMDGPTFFEFRSSFDFMGADRRYGNAGRTMIDFNNRSLVSATITTSYLNEINYVYEGGQGAGTDRIVTTLSDASSIAMGLTGGAVEGFNNATSLVQSVSLVADARQFLRDHRGRTIFNGTVRQTPRQRFGFEYNFGDIVTAQAFGLSFDCRISSISLKLDGVNEDILMTLQSVAVFTGGRV